MAITIVRFSRASEWVHLLLACSLLAGATGMPASPTGADIQYQRYVDPAEEAFADMVPQGWRVGGRLVRYGPITIAPFLQAMKQDGTIFVQLGDWHIKDYSDIPGWKEGTVYTPGTSVMLIRRLQTAEQYGNSYAGVFARQLGCEQSQVVDSESVANPTSGVRIPGSKLESSVVRFTCLRSGQHYEGRVMVTVQSYRLPMAATGWNILYLASFLAREDVADVGLAVWDKMRTTIQFLPEWNARESRIAAAAIKPEQQALDSTLQQAQAFDEHVINGYITVNDPTTGTQTEINMGVDPYYFSDGQGHFYCSYNPSPRSGFHAVQPVP